MPNSVDLCHIVVLHNFLVCFFCIMGSWGWAHVSGRGAPNVQ